MRPDFATGVIERRVGVLRRRMRTEKQKMLAGELYRAGDPGIQADQAAAKLWMVRYNAALGASASERRTLLRELLAVYIYTADHPRDPMLRKTGVEFGRPISIGQNVWIGGGAIILPGLSIGDDAVVGAGAVVTRDVPRGATVLGNPARQKQ